MVWSGGCYQRVWFLGSVWGLRGNKTERQVGGWERDGDYLAVDALVWVSGLW